MKENTQMENVNYNLLNINYREIYNKIKIYSEALNKKN